MESDLARDWTPLARLQVEVANGFDKYLRLLQTIVV